jgi:predicted transcriptional regulator
LPSLWSKVSGFGRFARQLQTLVNEPITLDQASARIGDGVVRRHERFLAMLTRVVAPNPRSPYRQLMASAGCSVADVATLVARDGLDEALQFLARAGVYVSYDEFKCRKPAVRGSQTFRFTPEDFDDPLVTRYYSARSSGTRGAATRVAIDADLIADMATYWAVFLAEHDALTTPTAVLDAKSCGRRRTLPRVRGKRDRSTVTGSCPRACTISRNGRTASSVHRLARRAGRFPQAAHRVVRRPGSRARSACSS